MSPLSDVGPVGSSAPSPHPSSPLYRPSTISSSTAAASASRRSSRRLYVGNLHPSVSEYDLAQLFGPFGKLSKLELVFHRSGPLRGKPKGFAFIEFLKEEEALKAKLATEGRDWKGSRTLSVNFANLHEDGNGAVTSSQSGPVRRNRRPDGGDEALKPTTLSLMKNSQRPQGGTNAKIAAMEAKLQALKQAKDGVALDAQGLSSAAASSSLLQTPPASAGLPKKPIVAPASSKSSPYPAPSSRRSKS